MKMNILTGVVESNEYWEGWIARQSFRTEAERAFYATLVEVDK